MKGLGRRQTTKCGAKRQARTLSQDHATTPEDSIVATTTTFLRTRLTCIDCCLQPNRGLLATKRRRTFDNETKKINELEQNGYKSNAENSGHKTGKCVPQYLNECRPGDVDRSGG